MTANPLDQLRLDEMKAPCQGYGVDELAVLGSALVRSYDGDLPD